MNLGGLLDLLVVYLLARKVISLGFDFRSKSHNLIQPYSALFNLQTYSTLYNLIQLF